MDEVLLDPNNEISIYEEENSTAELSFDTVIENINFIERENALRDTIIDYAKKMSDIPSESLKIQFCHFLHPAKTNMRNNIINLPSSFLLMPSEIAQFKKLFDLDSVESNEMIEKINKTFGKSSNDNRGLNKLYFFGKLSTEENKDVIFKECVELSCLHELRHLASKNKSLAYLNVTIKIILCVIIIIACLSVLSLVFLFATSLIAISIFHVGMYVGICLLVIPFTYFLSKVIYSLISKKIEKNCDLQALSVYKETNKKDSSGEGIVKYYECQATAKKKFIFFSTHPSDRDRAKYLQAALEKSS